MAKTNYKKNNNLKVVEKSDWNSRFFLIGTPVINDYTFKIDNESEKSSWRYNALNLGLDCGEKCGKVYSEMMGGFSANVNASPVIYVHGVKEENGQKRDDFKNRFEVSWEDRFNEGVLESIGNQCFINVGLECTKEGKVFYKRFLSEYDAIAYIKKVFDEYEESNDRKYDIPITISGGLKYSMYNGKVNTRKNIKTIRLANENDKPTATFRQSILFNKESVNLKEADTKRGILYINALVLDYLKEYMGKEVRTQYPFGRTFEFEVDFSNKEKAMNRIKMFTETAKKKGYYTQFTFKGLILESGAKIEPTFEDLPPDMQNFVTWGSVKLEDALKSCAANGGRETRFIIKEPDVKMVSKDDISTPVLQMFPERYTDEDLDFSHLFIEDEPEDDEYEALEDSDVADLYDESAEMSLSEDNSKGEFDWLNEV